MRKKSSKAIQFIEHLHEFIVNDPQFRRRTKGRSEVQIQTEIRPLIIRYLENYFAGTGIQDAVAKAHKSFYWEGQEGQFGRERKPTFGARNYPDFIIEDPYRLAIEYKQSPNGSLVKQLIGQSIVHTMSGDFDFVYCLFHDQSTDKRIRDSRGNPEESEIVSRIWQDFNVYLKFV